MAHHHGTLNENQRVPLTRVSSPADLSCPSWARTRTLLIQRGRCNHPNSGNLQPFTRVRATRCRSLKTFMPDFAVLYSLKCRSLLRSADPTGIAVGQGRSSPAATTPVNLCPSPCSTRRHSNCDDRLRPSALRVTFPAIHTREAAGIRVRRPSMTHRSDPQAQGPSGILPWPQCPSPDRCSSPYVPAP